MRPGGGAASEFADRMPQIKRLRGAVRHISYAAWCGKSSPRPRFTRRLMPLLTPSTASRHQTKQEFVYQTLRTALLTCELKPGERLVIDDLSRRLGVSIIPVREALQMLQAEGLVVNVPHVGAAVAPISRESIVDVFSVLEGLEVVATRLVAQQHSAAALRTLARLVKTMDEASEQGRFEDWADLNTRFHHEISAATGLPLLRDLTDRTLGRWDRIRRYYFNGVLSHRVPDAQAEHREILSALEARDLPRLETSVQHHNRAALEAYMTFV
jgi:DNA-binding GntR family transcriptional regulator